MDSHCCTEQILCGISYLGKDHAHLEQLAGEGASLAAAAGREGRGDQPAVKRGCSRIIDGMGAGKKSDEM